MATSLTSGNDILDETTGVTALDVDALTGNDSIFGTASADSILGSEGFDTLKGGAGNDTIVGDDGSDTTEGSNVDWIYGGRGEDSLDGGAGNDVIYGGISAANPNDTNDTIIGGDGDDIIFGNGGDDSITGNDGADTIYAGFGDDLVYGGALSELSDQGDVVYAGPGSDVVYGSSGDDTIYGGRGVVDATDGGDTIYGDAGNDLIFGNAGDDSLAGGYGDDTLYAGLGNDTLVGGEGSDTFYINDTTSSDAGGNDSVAFSTRFATRLNGNTGPVIADFDAFDSMQIITSNGGSTRFSDLHFTQSGSHTFMELPNGFFIQFQNHAPNDFSENNFSFNAPGDLPPPPSPGDDTTDGGTPPPPPSGGGGGGVSATSSLIATEASGLLTISGRASAKVLIDLSADTMTDGGVTVTISPGDIANAVSIDASGILNKPIKLDSVEPGTAATVTGTNFSDLITGDSQADSLVGGDGRDTIIGGAGNDTINGEDGDDSIDGGADNDNIQGDIGNDTIDGGAGDDIIAAGTGDDLITTGTGNDEVANDGSTDGLDIITDFDGSSDALSSALDAGDFTYFPQTGRIVANASTSHGWQFSDSVGGSNGTAFHEQNFDVTNGGPGAGKFMSMTDNSGGITGSSDDDLMITGGTTSGKTIAGGAGNDRIIGGTTNANTFQGDAGNDTLHGSGGNDTFTGGADDDTFVSTFGNGANDDLDVITDFGTGDDSLQIDLMGNALDYLTGSNALVSLSDNTQGFVFFGATGLDDVNFDESIQGGANMGKILSMVDNSAGLTGSDDNDLLYAAGTTSGKTFDGGSGNDRIYDDTTNANLIVGASGNDDIDAGDGNDTIVGGSGADTIIGGNGADVFVIDGSEDSVDIITDFDVSSDVLYTDDYDMSGFSYTLSTNSWSTSGGIGFQFTDSVGADNGTGMDNANFNVTNAGTTGGKVLSMVDNSGGLTGSSVGDFLYVAGTTSGKTIDGGDGDDRIQSDGAGVNELLGGAGADTISAGSGGDTLYGGEGIDSLAGGSGNDHFIVVGTTVANEYGGGDAYFADLTTINSHSTSDSGTDGTGETYAGGAGTDTLVIYGTADLSGATLTGIENIIVNSDVTLNVDDLAAAGVTSITGDGASAIRMGAGASGAFDMSGITLSNIGQLDVDDGLTLTMSQANIGACGTVSTDSINAVVQAATGTLDFTGINVYGAGTVNDATGASVGDIDAQAGATDLNTILDAMDTLISNLNTNLNGTPGYTTQSNTGLNVTDMDLLTGNLVAIELLAATDNPTFVLGGTQGDSLFGGSASDFIAGQGGADRIEGDASRDFIDGGAGDDTLDGGAGNDLISGDDDSDDIDGGAGQDFIDGGAGNDTIDGGADSDFVTGGNGDDQFEFSNYASYDYIGDFSNSGQNDVVGLDSTVFLGLGGPALVNDDTYIETSTALTAGAQDYSVGADTGVGILAYENAGAVQLYYTSNVEAATTANSALFAILNSVGLGDIDFNDVVTF